MRTRILGLIALVALIGSASAQTASSSASIRTLDSSGNVGGFTSLQLNSSGNAVISYGDDSNKDLKLAVCNNAICSSPIIRTVDGSSDEVGAFTSLQLDSNGYPVIAYYDDSNGALKLAHCVDTTCAAAASIETVDNSGTDIVGRFTSLQLNTLGNPVIVYYDATNGIVKLAVCVDPNCSSTPTINTIDTVGVDTGTLDVGAGITLLLDANEFPRISYYDFNQRDLRFAACSDTTCTTTPTRRTVDNGSDVGEFASMVFNSLGHPVISYRDSANEDLKLAVCADATCSSATLRVVDPLPGVADAATGTALQLDSFDRPVIVTYQNQTFPIPPTGFLRVARCLDTTCATTPIKTDIEVGGIVGLTPSMQLDARGYPVMSYYDFIPNNDLKYAICDSVSCQLPDPGDCNADSFIDAADLTAIALDLLAPGTFGTTGCDSDGSGSVTSADLSCTRDRIFNAAASC